MKENINKLVNQIRTSEKDHFLSRSLGYSYIRSNADCETEKRLFASLFRDINSTGQPLLPSESRRAMYYLEPSLRAFFEPSFLKSYKIGAIEIDFPRYLAYVNEFYDDYTSNGSNDLPTTSYIARGYSNKREEYILNYLTSAIVDDKSKQHLANMGVFESSFKKLITEENIRNIPSFELWIYGLIFWSLFNGKEINVNQKEVLKTKFSKHIPNPYKKISDIRERLEISIHAYQEVLKDA